MKNEHLKGCPFCGGEAFIRNNVVNGKLYIDVKHKRKCMFPALDTWLYASDMTIEEQMKKWNRRSI